jgi:hypothetical protein
MRNLLATTLVAFSLGFSTPAFAQYLSALEAVASIADYDFYQAAEEAHDLGGVRVVRISTLPGADGVVDRLAAARDLKERAISYLQSQLVLNFQANVAMNGAGVVIGQIVAIYRTGPNGAIIYADDLIY